MLRTLIVGLLTLVCAGCDLFAPPGDRLAAATPGSAQPQGQNLQGLSASHWVDLSLTYYRQKKFLQSIAAAQTAIYMQPDNGEAYNNISAAYVELGLWDPAILAAQQALRISPDNTLFRNNLAWAQERKRISGR